MNRSTTDSAIEQLDWTGLSRRRFLGGALGLAGVALGGGVAVSGCSTQDGLAADGKALLFLNAAEAATLNALGEAIVPPQQGFPTLAETEVVRRIDEELYFVGESIRSDMRAALTVMAWAPLVYGRFSRFHKLDEPGRLAVLARMMNSSSEILRAVGSNLKLLVHFMYFGHPSSWAAIGYDGPFAQLPPIASAQRRHYAEQTGRAGS